MINRGQKLSVELDVKASKYLPSISPELIPRLSFRYISLTQKEQKKNPIREGILPTVCL